MPFEPRLLAESATDSASTRNLRMSELRPVFISLGWRIMEGMMTERARGG